jgi:hypothetical protein
MALVTGPAMSLDASGTIGGVMTFSKWKGRNYIRQCVKPSNPKTAAQTGLRAMLSFLSQAWAAIKVASSASYLEMADNDKVSTFNEYVKYNQNRWREGKGVSQSYPAAETATAGTITLGTPAGGQRNITLTVTPSTATGLWGIAIFRDTATITTVNWNNCIKIIETTTTAAKVYTDSPLDAGTYHYRAAFLTSDGKIGTACADQSGAAT